MAYGSEQFIARDPVAHTIHVWPTRELIAQSWTWSERWHAAYQEMAWAISLAAATQVLEGGTFAGTEIDTETGIGSVTFAISQVGTTVHIVVSEFSGPNAPDPDGGIEAQPHAIGGLVIGLRSGRNGTFHVVIFHGSVPTIPCINRMNSNISHQVFDMVDRVQPDALYIHSDLNKLSANIPKTTSAVWVREILLALQAFLTAGPTTIHDSPVASVRFDHLGKIPENREGAEITSSRLPVILSSANTQAIFIGAAIMASAYRTNSLPPRNAGNSCAHLHLQ